MLFVATAPSRGVLDLYHHRHKTISPVDMKRLLSCVDEIVQVENGGYDFGMWNKVLNAHSENLGQYDELCLVNDSCVCFSSLSPYFAWHEQSSADVTGITLSYDVERHLQSFFLCVKSSAFKDVVQYLRTLDLHHSSFEEVIESGELGLSYKLMMRMAKDLGLPQVTICEDDVLFDEKFERRFAHIKQTLTTADEPWDIFSGLIADLSKKTEIFHSAIQSDEEAFYAINRLVSMVFNIYNKTSYQKIIDWDDKTHVPSNTIDRYIEQHDGINGLIVSPFLVGHKEDAASTLWGFQNTQYKDMIEKSQIVLNQMIDELSQRKSDEALV